MSWPDQTSYHPSKFFPKYDKSAPDFIKIVQLRGTAKNLIPMICHQYATPRHHNSNVSLRRTIRPASRLAQDPLLSLFRKAQAVSNNGIPDVQKTAKAINNRRAKVYDYSYNNIITNN